MKTKRIVYDGMYLALFYVLDVITHMVPILKMPQGGSVGLSVIALLLCSYHMGIVDGVIVGLASIFIQFLTGDVYMDTFLAALLDYIIPFGIYGIAKLFPNFKLGPVDLYSGVLITSVIRWFSHVLSGVYAYGSGWAGSIAYNTPYMLATTAVAIVLVPLLHRSLKSLLKD